MRNLWVLLSALVLASAATEASATTTATTTAAVGKKVATAVEAAVEEPGWDGKLNNVLEKLAEKAGIAAEGLKDLSKILIRETMYWGVLQLVCTTLLCVCIVLGAIMISRVFSTAERKPKGNSPPSGRAPNDYLSEADIQIGTYLPLGFGALICGVVLTIGGSHAFWNLAAPTRSVLQSILGTG